MAFGFSVAGRTCSSAFTTRLRPMTRRAQRLRAGMVVAGFNVVAFTADPALALYVVDGGRLAAGLADAAVPLERGLADGCPVAR